MAFTISSLVIETWEYVLFGVSPLRPTSERSSIMSIFLQNKEKFLGALSVVTITNRRYICSRYVLILRSFSTDFAPLGLTFCFDFVIFSLTYANTFSFQFWNSWMPVLLSVAIFSMQELIACRWDPLTIIFLVYYF